MNGARPRALDGLVARCVDRRRVSFALALATAAALAVDSVVFWTSARYGTALDAVEDATGGLVRPTLAGSLLLLALLAALWFGAGRLRAHDVGWRARDLPAAAALLLLTWTTIQLARAVIALAAGDGLAWSGAARDDGLDLAARVAEQLLGTGLLEETVHRGVLMPALLVWFRHRDPARPRTVAALLAGAAWFAALHVGMLHDQGHDGWAAFAALVGLALVGVYFALLYLRTGNLFVVAVLHALGNQPGDVVASPLPGQPLVYLVGLVCLWRWPAPAPATPAASAAPRRAPPASPPRSPTARSAS